MKNVDLDNWATWREIQAQPEIWRTWAQEFDPQPIADWIAGLKVDEIWFSGAGTSAYIGDCIVAALEGQGHKLRSVPSTDIVSRPKAYLTGRNPLIVNFGRSGDSTETIGVLDALDALVPRAARLNITCNADGALAKRPSNGEQRVVVLPAATHDSGFAMTSSFTTMLMTALGCLVPDEFGRRLLALAEAFGDLDLSRSAPPQRCVFLGAGPLTFAAREAALKVLELSAGQIPAIWDSSLGFRHGPKSFVTDQSAIFLFLSTDATARAYDDDLIAELRAQFPKAEIKTIGPRGDIDVPKMSPGWDAILPVVVAQRLSVIWSAELGLNVDNPFEGQGTLTRVVSGVKLHPVNQ